jgi:hypothetical protein
MNPPLLFSFFPVAFCAGSFSSPIESFLVATPCISSGLDTTLSDVITTLNKVYKSPKIPNILFTTFLLNMTWRVVPTNPSTLNVRKS